MSLFVNQKYRSTRTGGQGRWLQRELVFLAFDTIALTEWTLKAGFLKHYVAETSRLRRVLCGASTHQLLGIGCPDEINDEASWRNCLHPREVSWPMRHQIQNHFPNCWIYMTGCRGSCPAIWQGSRTASWLSERYYRASVGFSAKTRRSRCCWSLMLSRKLRVQSPRCSHFTRAPIKTYYGHDPQRVWSSWGYSWGAVSWYLPSHVEHQESFLDLELERFYNAVSDLGFGLSALLPFACQHA